MPTPLKTLELERAAAEKAKVTSVAVPPQRAVRSYGVPPATQGADLVKAMRDAADLRAQGFLSDEEFAAIKRRLLGEGP
jgi:hypothetical protein